MVLSEMSQINGIDSEVFLSYLGYKGQNQENNKFPLKRNSEWEKKFWYEASQGQRGCQERKNATLVQRTDSKTKGSSVSYRGRLKKGRKHDNEK